MYVIAQARVIAQVRAIAQARAIAQVRAPGGRRAYRARGVWECGAYGWYFSSTVSAPPDLGFMVTRTVTLLVFAAFSSCSTVHFEVP